MKVADTKGFFFVSCMMAMVMKTESSGTNSVVSM